MNLTAQEKKDIVEAHATGNNDVLRALFAKAHGSCNMCTSISYINQWMQYWFATNQLKKP